MTDPTAIATVEVRVEFKPGVLDPEAASIEKSLGLLGIPDVAHVRTARVYRLEFAGIPHAEAERLAARAVDRLLANPVIHRVTITPRAHSVGRCRDRPRARPPSGRRGRARSRSGTGTLASVARSGLGKGLAFSPTEWTRLRAYFRAEGRDPTDVELAAVAQSWSEHCSYKSSKIWIKRAFRGLNPSRRVLGTGDAGVLVFDDGYAYAIRAESHNHPSAVEPYGGAATGIGGILRDVLAVGGKPIALADPLFFGSD